jgi:hypothetical protein
MRQITTTRVVDAPTAAVWAALTDFESHAEWDPFITAIEGAPTVGTRLRVRIAAPGRRAMTLRPRVTVVDSERHFEWLGSVGVRGLFDGRHSFRLEPRPDGRTLLTHAETFTGILVPLLWRSLEPSTRAGFEAFNDALAQRVAACCGTT